MQRRFLSNYRFWLLLGLLLAGWSASPAYAQEQDFFSLLDEDRRREFTLELGPSFMEDPVFRGFEDASGVIHPATKVNLKTPRHISGTFGWRLNDWLRVQASINFNAADFSGASSADAVQEEVFNQTMIERLQNQTNDGQNNLLVNGVCEDNDFATVSVYCLVSNRVYSQQFPAIENSSIRGTQEYMDASEDDSCDDGCALMRARTNIITDEAGEMALEMARMQGDVSAFIMGRPEYTAALNDMEGCDGNEACALMLAETAIRTDEAGVIRLRDFRTQADDMAHTNGREQANLAAGAAEFQVERQTYSAEGTFFSISSFLSAYADIPLTSGIWLYGGGGAGVSWSHVKEGFYTRDTSFNLTNADDIEENIESNLELEADDLNVRFDLLESSRPQRTDIISTITSFAMTGAVGFRTEVFEGLVVDSGYQVIWTQKGFYRGADEKIAHLVRVGFVFNF